MKNITFFVLFSCLFFTSCATVFPVHNPDMTRDEYAGLVAAGSDRTACYEHGFRGGMLFLDVILGAPLFWTPLLFDAATGKFTAYYYHHKNCEKVKAQERNARLAGYQDSLAATVIQQTPAPSAPKPVPVEQPAQPSWDAPISQAEPAPAPTPVQSPQTEEDPEYDILF